SGLRPLRDTNVELIPPILNPAFGEITATGATMRNGYVFRLFLPDAGGVGLAETDSNVALIDPRFSAEFFTCVAWPNAYGRSGQRTFFLCQTGTIMTTIDVRYSGEASGPAANAAMTGVTDGRIDTHELASGVVVGVDGNRWQEVQ
ncbi:MAG TPA: hypothetical protein PKE00_03640, partial [Planctomycetota bacterium]|nr:hypothetical protein [Planctomycetota bacterium]